MCWRTWCNDLCLCKHDLSGAIRNASSHIDRTHNDPLDIVDTGQSLLFNILPRQGRVKPGRIEARMSSLAFLVTELQVAAPTRSSRELGITDIPSQSLASESRRKHPEIREVSQPFVFLTILAHARTGSGEIARDPQVFPGTSYSLTRIWWVRASSSSLFLSSHLWKTVHSPMTSYDRSLWGAPPKMRKSSRYRLGRFSGSLRSRQSPSPPCL